MGAQSDCGMSVRADGVAFCVSAAMVKNMKITDKH